MIGQTISHYKILSKLGEGGMGVVYKAEDTKLDRTVALKLLRFGMGEDIAQQARFIHEAKAAAALSHPNICPIHSIEEQDGELFIVMDFIDGQTLRQKLQAGLIPVKQGVAIGIQIAEGLGAAHELGVVHRDIKPENIMIRKDGLVQIMDFGLAKLRGASRLTKEGSTIGTVGYMSPQQVQGLDVDSRTDIFALGVVLYEILSGELPFRGPHPAAIIYEIVNVDPPPVSSHRKDVSHELSAIVADCIAKEPDDRFQFAKEVSRQLKRVQKESDQQRVLFKAPTEDAENRSSNSLPGYGPPKRVAKLRVPILWTVTAATIVVLSILFVFPFWKRSPELNPNMTVRSLKTPLPHAWYPGMTADGSWIAFPGMDDKGRWDLYVMNTSGGDARRVTNENITLINSGADISPDGSQIAFDGSDLAKPNTVKVRVVPTLGGLSKAIVDQGIAPSWRPDGKRIGYLLPRQRSKSGHLELWTVRPDGSDNRLEYLDTTEFDGSFAFAWSPDGISIAWLRSFSGGFQEIVVINLGSRTERQVTFDRKIIDFLCWARNDFIIFSSNKAGNTNLWMVPADGGTSVQITNGSGSESGMKISADGKKLVFVQQQMMGNIWLASIDGLSTRKVTFDDADVWLPTLSPDGKHIAFQTGTPYFFNSPMSISVMDRDGNNRRQLTSVERPAGTPQWSPDGRWIAFNANPTPISPDSIQVYLVDPSNMQKERFIGKGHLRGWADDTTVITAMRTRSWLTSIKGGEPKPCFEDSTMASPVISGKYILYYDLRIGSRGWWIVPADRQRTPSRDGARRITSGGERLWVSHDFGQLLLLTEERSFFRISLPDGKREKVPVTLLSGTRLNIGGCVSYDGREIVYVDTGLKTKFALIENLFR